MEAADCPGTGGQRLLTFQQSLFAISNKHENENPSCANARTGAPPASIDALANTRASYFATQEYELSDPAGPFEYFGYSGYEHIGRLRSPAVTGTDFPGALPFSTQSTIRPSRL